MEKWINSLAYLTCLRHISPGHGFIQAHGGGNFWKKVPNLYDESLTTEYQMLWNKPKPTYPPSNSSL